MLVVSKLSVCCRFQSSEDHDNSPQRDIRWVDVSAVLLVHVWLWNANYPCRIGPIVVPFQRLTLDWFIWVFSVVIQCDNVRPSGARRCIASARAKQRRALVVRSLGLVFGARSAKCMFRQVGANRVMHKSVIEIMVPVERSKGSALFTQGGEARWRPYPLN